MANTLYQISSRLSQTLLSPQLRSFLGLLNYYRSFLPNIASVLHPLNELLQANHRWKWSQECAAAFRKAKEMLVTSKVLAHYDPTTNSSRC